MKVSDYKEAKEYLISVGYGAYIDDLTAIETIELAEKIKKER